MQFFLVFLCKSELLFFFELMEHEQQHQLQLKQQQPELCLRVILLYFLLSLHLFPELQ